MRSTLMNFGPRLLEASRVAIPTMPAAIATRAAIAVSIRRRLSENGIWGHPRRASAGYSVPAHEPVHRPVQRGGIERAVRALAEGAQIAYPDAAGAVFAGTAETRDQRADLARAEVAVDVPAPQ